MKFTSVALLFLMMSFNSFSAEKGGNGGGGASQRLWDAILENYSETHKCMGEKISDKEESIGSFTLEIEKNNLCESLSEKMGKKSVARDLGPFEEISSSYFKDCCDRNQMEGIF
jgi:hypothetical protein